MRRFLKICKYGHYTKAVAFAIMLCPLCTGNEIEDETHLLLDCQRYSSMRDIFLSKIETKIDEIRKLSHENLISQLMNSNDYYVNNIEGKITECLLVNEEGIFS